MIINYFNFINQLLSFFGLFTLSFEHKEETNEFLFLSSTEKWNFQAKMNQGVFLSSDFSYCIFGEHR